MNHIAQTPPQEEIQPISEPTDQKRITQPFMEYQLNSFFQPIYSVAHRRIIGYEGLVRPFRKDGSLASPEQLFATPQSLNEMQKLDQQCRKLHISNFFNQRQDNEWLFVNLNSQLLNSDSPEQDLAFSSCDSTALPPYSLVVEILENEIHNPTRLKQYIDFLRQQNCLIAIDDFGAGYSNFDRIWQLEPDIVKIDRSLIQQASSDRRAERILSGMISLLHEAGSLVVVEGIETEQEACIAINSDADMVQGFLFAHPGPLLLDQFSKQPIMDKLLGLRNRELNLRHTQRENSLRDIRDQFQTVAKALIAGSTLKDSSSLLFSAPRTTRCYLLNEDGYQLEGYRNNTHAQTQESVKLSPLMTGQMGNWSHRPYHAEALKKPYKTLVSAPYLSVINARMCTSLSQAFRIDGKLRVLCCDLDSQD